MSARNPLDFSDLERPSDLDAPAPGAEPATFLDAQAAYAQNAQPAEIQCPACHGSGTFYSKFSGRAVGPCYTCNGTGRTTAQHLKRRDAARKGNATREANEHARRAAFTQAHGDVLDYLQARASRWQFAASLLQQFADRGTLTENQLAAVHRAMESDRMRDEERAAQRRVLQPSVDPSAIDLSPLPAGRYAVPGGDTRLKVLVRRPKESSRWHGWTFVSDAALYGARKSYGKQPPGGRYQGDIKDQLRAILANPQAASAAYGKLTGTCGVCGAHLEDEESVARGIGPICAGKF